MNGLELEKGEERDVREAESLAIKYGEVRIITNQDYTEAGEVLRDISGRIKTLESMRLEKTRPLDKLKKDWIEFFNKPLEKLKSADMMIRQAMARYFNEQEAAKRSEEARLKELADKEAKRLENRADKAEASGKEGKAEELREQAQQLVATVPAVENKAGKVEGVSMKTVWKYEIVDETKLDRKWLMPDDKKIGQAVRALKGDFRETGIRVYGETVPNVRT